MTTLEAVLLDGVRAWAAASPATNTGPVRHSEVYRVCQTLRHYATREDAERERRPGRRVRQCSFCGEWRTEAR